MKKNFIIMTILFATTFATSAQNPNIIFPAGSPQRVEAQLAVSDSNAIITRRVVAHAADILSPQIYSVITEFPVIYEIAPTIDADSVLLFVRHSHTQIDTLGIFTSPPFRAEWNPESYSENFTDQDQIHLQFGYTIFTGDTLVTISPPLPHRYMIAANRPAHRKGEEPMYRAKQLAFVAFDVDGDLEKWRDIKAEPIGDAGYFKMLWTAARLHFIVNVRDSSVTPADFIEFHVDMHRDRADFSSVNHRSIRYSPLSGSRSFVVELTPDGFIYADSVNAFISDEGEWKSVVTDSGYIIEAAIPFVALANITQPPPVIGVDFSIMNIDRTNAGFVSSYTSWSGGTQFFRYSPNTWGAVKMGRATLALQSVFMFVIFLTCAAFVFFIAHNFITEHRKNKRDPIDNDNYLPLTDLVLDDIENNLGDKNFSMTTLSNRINKSQEEIEAALQKDMDINFEQLLLFKRIKRSQKLMRDESLSILEISEKCGFADIAIYRKAFKAQMRFDPEVSRQALLDSIREDELDREEDEED